MHDDTLGMTHDDTLGMTHDDTLGMMHDDTLEMMHDDNFMCLNIQLTFALGSSMLSLIGIGTVSISFAISSFSSCCHDNTKQYNYVIL